MSALSASAVAAALALDKQGSVSSATNADVVGIALVIDVIITGIIVYVVVVCYCCCCMRDFTIAGELLLTAIAEHRRNTIPMMSGCSLCINMLLL